MTGVESDFSGFRNLDPPHTYVHPSEQVAGGYRKIHLAEGQSPFGPPPEYNLLRKKLEEEGLFEEYGTAYKEINIEPAINNVRERFGISEKPYVVFSAGGSDEILERVTMWLLKPEKVRIRGIGPHFPDIYNFAHRFTEKGISSEKDLLYGPIITPLTDDLDKGIEEAINSRNRNSRMKNIVWYLCNPGTPKGDTASDEAIKEFADYTENKGDLLIIDEAFGDALEDNSSAVPLAEDNKNLIVLRSLSKVVGLAGERIGYSVMSRNIGDQYEKIRRQYDIPGHTQLIANAMTDPEILTPHLEDVRAKNIEVKSQLLNALEEEKISYLPTDVRVPIFMIDGEVSNFYDRLLYTGLDVTPGEGFRDTYDDTLTNRYVRLAIPKETKDISIIINRIKAAMFRLRGV